MEHGISPKSDFFRVPGSGSVPDLILGGLLEVFWRVLVGFREVFGRFLEHFRRGFDVIFATSL